MPDPAKNGDSETSPENIRELLREQGASSKRVAKLLDECFRIPGTRIRFGLDPILGLIPGGGEVVASVIGAYIVGDATRKGIPFSMLFKMAGNMLLNGILGIIPGLGDVFSVWFKSNSRNYRLMREHLESTNGKPPQGGWWPMIVAASLLGAVFMVNILIWFLVWRALYEVISRAM